MIIELIITKPDQVVMVVSQVRIYAHLAERIHLKYMILSWGLSKEIRPKTDRKGRVKGAKCFLLFFIKTICNILDNWF